MYRVCFLEQVIVQHRQIYHLEVHLLENNRVSASLPKGGSLREDIQTKAKPNIDLKSKREEDL